MPEKLRVGPTKRVATPPFQLCLTFFLVSSSPPDPPAARLYLSVMSSGRRLHCILTLLFLILLLPLAGAQSSPDGDGDGDNDELPPYNNQLTPSLAIIVVVVVASLFLMGFITIYIRRNSEMDGQNNIVAVIAGGGGRLRQPHGLDRAVIDSFPTFAYSTVKGIKIGKGALECAVCLSEFEEEDTLRLIPKCDHVFHPDCIDAWLDHHTTCPVCRAQLTPDPDESLHARRSAAGSTTTEDMEAQSVDAYTEQQGAEPSSRTSYARRALQENEPEILEFLRAKLNRNRRSKSTRRMLNRSHSTGKLLIKPGDNIERFTLKLPVEIRKQIVNQKLHRATSAVVLPRETSSRMTYRTGGDNKGCSRSGSKGLDRLFRSDRWIAPFFSKMISPKVAATDDQGTSTRPVLPGGPRSDSVHPPV